LPTKREERGPSEFDMVPYPKEGVYYTVPKCKMLNGVGNPEQHLTLFKATCGNTGGNEALLILFGTKYKSEF